jgi:hypothetical protein
MQELTGVAPSGAGDTLPVRGAAEPREFGHAQVRLGHEQGLDQSNLPPF